MLVNSFINKCDSGAHQASGSRQCLVGGGGGGGVSIAIFVMVKSLNWLTCSNKAVSNTGILIRKEC